jgi:hypothetical protein
VPDISDQLEAIETFARSIRSLTDKDSVAKGLVDERIALAVFDLAEGIQRHVGEIAAVRWSPDWPFSTTDEYHPKD